MAKFLGSAAAARTPSGASHSAQLAVAMLPSVSTCVEA